VTEDTSSSHDQSMNMYFLWLTL